MPGIITKDNLDEAEAALRKAAPDCRPRIALILGSGLGGLAASIEDGICVPYGELPPMPTSTAPGHVGCFVCGRLHQSEVVCMQGRLHAYEGYGADEIAFGVHLMHRLGADTLIVTNAAGAVNKNYAVGDLMLIDDHINFQMMNPGIGAEDPDVGPRFYDMTGAYDAALREQAERAAVEAGITLHHGIYLGCTGPSFETPAEIEAFRTLGADAVGMSTVQEVIAARQIGMRVLGISLISNMAAGIEDEVSMEAVDRGMEAGADSMERLIGKVL
ncbi:MAG: purine-nucleoside phosphorylase [Coriobacteriaceae bacterium]|nr:purine-nucleoside phosphorylase [Coriobacteriaceae bacterium]